MAAEPYAVLAADIAHIVRMMSDLEEHRYAAWSKAVDQARAWATRDGKCADQAAVEASDTFKKEYLKTELQKLQSKASELGVVLDIGLLAVLIPAVGDLVRAGWDSSSASC